ncbi:MAG: NUDIX domain-containing protein [Cyanobacteria bacterium P01_F01_bin.153]
MNVEMNLEMDADVPNDARLSARVLVFDQDDRILLLQGQSSDGQTFWIMPGGGLQASEAFSDAAAREVFEETGLRVKIGPCIWTRRHQFQWKGRLHDQYERYFVGVTRVSNVNLPSNLTEPDDYIIGYRWWTLKEIAESDEEFVPRSLAQLLPPILQGNYPTKPFNCGV